MTMGAQNIFVLRQAITRRHVTTTASVCLAVETGLIALGVDAGPGGSGHRICACSGSRPGLAGDGDRGARFLVKQADAGTEV